jgi:hypothetical protein
MTVQKLKGTIKEVAGVLYLFTSLVCLCVIGLHFIEQVDTEFQDLERVVEIIKNDPLAFLKGGDFANPEDFVNLFRIWL